MRRLATPESSTARRVALLRELPGFDGLPAEALAALAARLEEEQFAAGSIVIREGDPADRCYLVVSGRAEISVDQEGRSVPLGGVGAGGFFGELALALGGERQRPVRAASGRRSCADGGRRVCARVG
jgi:CRP-like cAMP-binding protein